MAEESINPDKIILGSILQQGTKPPFQFFSIDNSTVLPFAAMQLMQLGKVKYVQSTNYQWKRSSYFAKKFFSKLWEKAKAQLFLGFYVSLAYNNKLLIHLLTGIGTQR